MACDLDIRERLRRDGSILLAVKVIARAAKSEVLGVMEDGSLKVKLAALPEKGKANVELRALLSDHFAVSKSNIELVSGETSSHKRVRISANAS